jgi:hypothetical protein
MSAFLRAGACRSGVEGLRGAVANERFLLEAKALAVPVCDADEAEGLPYHALGCKGAT